MAHYAILNDDDIVIELITGRNEDLTIQVTVNIMTQKIIYILTNQKHFVQIMQV